MVHVHVHVHNLHCTIIFMLILGQSHIRINMHTLPFLQAITVLNHAGVCVSYQTAWKCLQLKHGTRKLCTVDTGSGSLTMSTCINGFDMSVKVHTCTFTSHLGYTPSFMYIHVHHV